MIVYFLKPLGYENYLGLKSVQDVKRVLKKLQPGDEIIIRVGEMTDEEFEKLSDFKGFD
jgi:hypothetical protein